MARSLLKPGQKPSKGSLAGGRGLGLGTGHEPYETLSFGMNLELFGGGLKVWLTVLMGAHSRNGVDMLLFSE